LKEAVLDGESGFLVEEGDWQQMAAKICELLCNSQFAVRMGQSGRRHIRDNYSIEVIGARWQVLIERLILRAKDTNTLPASRS